jgi:hypothetical protein
MRTTLLSAISSGMDSTAMRAIAYGENIPGA